MVRIGESVVHSKQFFFIENEQKTFSHNSHQDHRMKILKIQLISKNINTSETNFDSLSKATIKMQLQLSTFFLLIA